MRKSNLIMAIAIGYSPIASAQSAAYEQALQQELSPFSNQMGLFMDWLFAPPVQNFFLLITIVSCCYVLLLLGTQLLMVYNVLPKDSIKRVEKWMSLNQLFDAPQPLATNKLMVTVSEPSDPIKPQKVKATIQISKKEEQGMIQLQLALPKQDFENLLKNKGENQFVNILIEE